MFCKNCGNQLNDNAVICPNCGVPVNNSNLQNNRMQSGQTESNTVAIVGFIFAFFFPLVGLICSIIGLNNCNKTNAPNRGLAIAGIVISAISCFCSMLWMGSCFFYLF